MKTEQKVKILTWLVAALIIFTISSVATVIYRMRGDKNDSDHIQVEVDSFTMSGAHFRQVLHLSPRQMDEFRDLNQSFRQNARNINFNLDNLRNQMFEELKKKNPDTLRCVQLSDEMGDLHKELKILTCQFYLEMKQVCDPEQEYILQELFEPIFRSHPGFGYGRGGGRYRRGQSVPPRFYQQ